MHQPETNQFAYIDRPDFERLRRGRPVYEDAPNVVIVSPEEFANTPKLTAPVRLPHVVTNEERELARLKKSTATAISRVMHRKKNAKR